MYVCMYCMYAIKQLNKFQSFHLFNSAGASGQVVDTALRDQHHIFQPNSAEATEPTRQQTMVHACTFHY